ATEAITAKANAKAPLATISSRSKRAAAAGSGGGRGIYLSTLELAGKSGQHGLYADCARESIIGSGAGDSLPARGDQSTERAMPGGKSASGSICPGSDY